MSYAICTVVVGCHLGDRILSYVLECDLRPDDIGCHGLYSSGGSGPWYVGSGGSGPWYVGIPISEFDECTRLKASELIPRLKSPKKQVVQARQLIAVTKKKLAAILDGEIPPSWNNDDIPADKRELITYRTGKERQRLLDCIPDEPDVHLVWSSS